MGTIMQPANGSASHTRWPADLPSDPSVRPSQPVMQPWTWQDIGAAAVAMLVVAAVLDRVARSIVGWLRARAAAALPDGQQRLLRGIKTKGSGVRRQHVNPMGGTAGPVPGRLHALPAVPAIDCCSCASLPACSMQATCTN